MSAGGNFLGGDILMCPADCRRIMNFLNGLWGEERDSISWEFCLSFL